MKKALYVIGLLMLSFNLCSCENDPSNENEYRVYFVNEDGNQLVEQGYAPAAEDGEMLIRELLSYLKHPQGTYNSPIPMEVEISRFTLQDTHLILDFNRNYQNMDSVTEILLRASVVKTLVQVPLVTDVRFMIEGTELQDISGSEIGTMNSETFIDTQGDGINSYHYTSLSLYFTDPDGEKLIREMRNVHYSTNNSLEKVAVEELISGPNNDKLSPILPSSVKLLNSSVKGGTCTLNFDKSFNLSPSGSKATPEVSIYAIVNTICDVLQVSRVEIQIEGETEIEYRSTISLDQKFKRKTELIEQIIGDETSAEQIVESDPAVGVESVMNQTNREDIESDNKK